MTDINYNILYESFRKCSRCRSSKFQRCFGRNGRGEVYKTCVACRTKDRVNNEKYTNIKNNSIYINKYNFNNNNNDNLNYKQELII